MLIHLVVPAQAGTPAFLDSRLRGNDGGRMGSWKEESHAY
jgi:hypothetical protein